MLTLLLLVGFCAWLGVAVAVFAGLSIAWLMWAHQSRPYEGGWYAWIAMTWPLRLVGLALAWLIMRDIP